MKKIKYLLFLIICILLLNGCDKGGNEEISFNEFPQYKNFDSIISRIIVSLDNDGSIVEFEITDKDVINNIVDELLYDAEFKKIDEASENKNNSTVTFVNSNDSHIVVSLTEIRHEENQSYYTFNDNDFYELIITEAKRQGLI